MAGYDKTKVQRLPHEKSPEPPEQITPIVQQSAATSTAPSTSVVTASPQSAPTSGTASSTPAVGNSAPTALPESNPSSKVDASRPVAPDRSRIEMPGVNPVERREETEYVMRNMPVGDDEARERKRNRARSVVAAIGDGVSALANLYFTTQYAPNANLQPSLSKQNKERYDKRMEEFRARRKEYEAGLQRAKDRDKENGRYAQEWKYKMQQARQRQAEKAAEAAAKDAAVKAAADRHKEEMELKKADAEERKRHNEAQERNGARTARAAEIRASRSSRSGGGDGGDYTIHREDLGSTTSYEKPGEWERAARNMAKELGVATADTTEVRSGGRTTRRITQHSAPQIASAVEQAAKEKAKDRTMPKIGDDESRLPPSKRKKK